MIKSANLSWAYPNLFTRSSLYGLVLLSAIAGVSLQLPFIYKHLAFLAAPIEAMPGPVRWAVATLLVIVGGLVWLVLRRQHNRRLRAVGEMCLTISMMVILMAVFSYLIWSNFVVDTRYNWYTIARFWNPPDVVGRWTASLWRGLQTTIKISLASLLLAVTLGVIVGIARTSRQRIVHALGAAYVELFRNTPLIIQLFLWAFGTRQLLKFLDLEVALGLSPFASGMLGLGTYTAAFIGEAVRAGIQSIHYGQWEAAHSIGLRRFATLRFIILPQALRIVILPITSQFLSLYKNSSLVIVIGVTDLLFHANEVEAQTFRGFEIFTAAALLYLAGTLTLSALMSLINYWVRAEHRETTDQLPAFTRAWRRFTRRLEQSLAQVGRWLDRLHLSFGQKLAGLGLVVGLIAFTFGPWFGPFVSLNFLNTASVSGLNTLRSINPAWLQVATSERPLLGEPDNWDGLAVAKPVVLFSEGTFNLWYSGFDGTTWRIGLATSLDGHKWRRGGTVSISPGQSGPDQSLPTPTTGPPKPGAPLLEDVAAVTNPQDLVALAEQRGEDIASLAKTSAVPPVLAMGAPDTWDAAGVLAPSGLFGGQLFQMWYTGFNGTRWRIGQATSPDGMNWTRNGDGAVLNVTSEAWDSQHVGLPTIIWDGDVFKMWYAGSDGQIWRIGYATSTDGMTWTKSEGGPVLDVSPAGWNSVSITAPHVDMQGGDYVMTYAGFDGQTWQLGRAVSRDGLTWTHDPGNPLPGLNPAAVGEPPLVGAAVISQNGLDRIWYGQAVGKPLMQAISSSAKFNYRLLLLLAGASLVVGLLALGIGHLRGADMWSSLIMLALAWLAVAPIFHAFQLVVVNNARDVSFAEFGWGLWGVAISLVLVGLGAILDLFEREDERWGRLTLIGSLIGLSALVSALVWAGDPPLITQITKGVVVATRLDWGSIWRNRAFLWQGFQLTLFLSVVGITTSFALGTILGMMRMSRLAFIRLPAVTYIELVRGVPLMMLIIYTHISLPQVVDFSPETWQSALAALIAFTSTYIAEIVRAGIQSIHRGQWEAAHSLGLGYLRTMRFIILPQAIKRMIPPTVGQFITLFKDTSLVYWIGAVEFFRAVSITYNREFDALFPLLIFACLVYFIPSYGMSRIAEWLRNRMGASNSRDAISLA